MSNEKVLDNLREHVEEIGRDNVVCYCIRGSKGHLAFYGSSDRLLGACAATIVSSLKDDGFDLEDVIHFFSKAVKSYWKENSEEK